MTGGACQADATQSGLNQNAFTNMIDNMLTGDAMAQQRAEGQVMSQTAAQQEHMKEMQKQFDGMMNQEMMAKQFNQVQQQNHFAHLMRSQQSQQADLNSLWDAGASQVAQQQQPVQ